MKRKKLIMKKRALSWILALALSGSSLALPVSAAEPDDNVQVETYDETSDFENDADIEITDEGQDADGGASEDINDNRGWKCGRFLQISRMKKRQMRI